MKTKTNYEKVREFHQAMEQPLDQPFEPYQPLESLRWRLIREEVKELGKGVREHNLENVLKELADILYVTYGYAASYGWDIDVAFDRVHKSNMSKLDDEGKPVYREDGKVLKGPNYKPADLGDLV